MVQSIDDVILAIDKIVLKAKAENARFGYFASLYLAMTKAVKDGIIKHQFEDGPRMEKLCVKFANRYLVAFELWNSGKRPSEVWILAFNQSKYDNLTVIQHLLCSINAHINLDLGIAAAQICPGNQIGGLKTDFDRINNVLADLLDEVQVKLGRISWPMRFLDKIGKNLDEQIANFSLGVARESAWNVALSYSKLEESAHEAYISTLDKKMSQLARLIINPGVVANFLLKPVKWFEPKSPAKIIEILNA